MKKFAVVLAGCGVFDGAEIHEAVMTLYAIMKNGGVYEIFAPDIPQHHVVNHLTGQEMKETRNVLVEAARIARKKIKALSAFNPNDFDALIFPGGFGAAKNLFTYALDGTNFKINADVEKAVKAMLNLKKPIGALCISPMLLAKAVGDSVEVTIGNDASTAQHVEKVGGTHKTTTHGEIVVDTKHKVVTSPCYMLDATILDIEKGCDNAVKALLKLMD